MSVFTLRIFISSVLRMAAVIASPFLLCTCDSDERIATTLASKESKSYTGYVLHTIYEHDNNGRIKTIKEYKDDEEAAVTVTVSYSGNEAVLRSTPDFDPSLNQTTEVVLTLDANGRTLKRIEHTHKTRKTDLHSPYEMLVYDTLVFEYDASGFLIRTIGSRYDSSWTDENHNSVTRASSLSVYTIESGNVIALDRAVEYPRLIRDGATTIQAGGSSEYHYDFTYTSAYANRTDFRNAAILNEFKQDFELPWDINYANMPDKVTISTVDRDVEGAIIFQLESTREFTRLYNGDGMLSSVRIPANTQFTEVNYFYR